MGLQEKKLYRNKKTKKLYLLWTQGILDFPTRQEMVIFCDINAGKLIQLSSKDFIEKFDLVTEEIK